MKAIRNNEIILLEAIGSALEFFDNNIKDVGAFSKKESNRDLVTQWDVLIEELIIRKLLETKIPIIGEETAINTEYNTKAWIIDPIDGTTNFISGNPFYGISVGLIENGNFTLGAFGMPKTKELFYILNNAAYYNQKKIEFLAPSNMENSLISCSFSSESLNIESELREKEFITFGRINDLSRGCLRTGSAATNICYTMIGKFQATYGINAKIWDIAGALAIAQKSGCHIQMQKSEVKDCYNYIVGSESVVDEIASKLSNFDLIDMQKIIKIN
jgi:myo-inositol-1(or 4)-monophosphatase